MKTNLLFLISISENVELASDREPDLRMPVCATVHEGFNRNFLNSAPNERFNGTKIGLMNLKTR